MNYPLRSDGNETLCINQYGGFILTNEQDGTLTEATPEEAMAWLDKYFCRLYGPGATHEKN